MFTGILCSFIFEVNYLYPCLPIMVEQIKLYKVQSPLWFDGLGAKLSIEMPNWQGVTSEKFRGVEASVKTVDASCFGDIFSFSSPLEPSVTVFTAAICVETIKLSFQIKSTKKNMQLLVATKVGQHGSLKSIFIMESTGNDSFQKNTHNFIWKSHAEFHTKYSLALC